MQARLVVLKKVIAKNIYNSFNWRYDTRDMEIMYESYLFFILFFLLFFVFFNIIGKQIVAIFRLFAQIALCFS